VRPPRVFCIPALDAPVVAVLRRGPSDWANVGRWDVSSMSYQQGAWLRGRIYPQRCDLSPDGRWLTYFVMKASARWDLGSTYIATSELPWLTAVAAWATCGTWTRGLHFERDPSAWDVFEPDHGTVDALRGAVGLVPTEPASFAVERRRGWREVVGTPPRVRDDMWDERRAADLRLEKPRPGEPATKLEVTGEYAAFRSGPRTSAVTYRILAGAEEEKLQGVQWADWAADGRLLVATRAGELQVRELRAWQTPAEVVADLSGLVPDPRASDRRSG
jgi:hypothetical protein